SSMSLRLLSPQGHEQYGIPSPNFEHECRGALRLVPQLRKGGDLGAIRAADDVAAAQAVLGRRASRFDVLHDDTAAVRRVRQARARGSGEALALVLGCVVISR